MTSTSRAPLLSATLRRLSCWIIGLLRPLEDLDEPPALLLRQRPGLHHPDAVAGPQLVVLVVRVEPAGPDHRLLVERVRLAGRDLHDRRLVHRGRDDQALPDLAGPALGGGSGVGHHAFSSVSCSAAAISRARNSVLMRAMSRLTCRIRAWLVSWPVASWNRSLNSSSFASASCSTSAPSSRSLYVVFAIATAPLPWSRSGP